MSGPAHDRQDRPAEPSRYAAAERVRFADDGLTRWVGMRDAVLLSPDGAGEVLLLYAGEPPHGDSYHEASIDGRKLPGHVWGGMFGFDSSGRYLACGWMPRPFERRTIVIDITRARLFALPTYMPHFTVAWPSLKGAIDSPERGYTFGGRERWRRF